MIPIKLTIQGLYSYQEKQTIDFTRLTSSNLFGIFGAVGSGKSSILEAITFAIYGKTDRLNLSGDNRNYNMMNLKSNDLLIEFVFETGKNQTAYQAVVKGRRNGKKFEEVKTLERSAYRNEGGDWIPIEPEQLEKTIGLSYDNFKRTIIIPQGQFQEFLQLGNKDRTQMMKELFNLEKFELYYKVVSLENKNNSQKENLDGQLKQLGAIDPQCRIAEPGGADGVPAVARHEKDLLRRHAERGRPERITGRVGLVAARGGDRKHRVDQPVQARTLDCGREHLRVAVAQDAAANSVGPQCLQDLAHFGKRRQVPVLAHQLVFGLRRLRNV